MMREKRRQRLKERSLNKQAKGMAAAIEGKGGKSRRLLKRAGKLMKKASRDSKDPYSDKVYTINKGFIGEKRGERILKKAEKKGDVRKFDTPGGRVEITKGSKGRKTVTKYKGKESGPAFYQLKKEGTKGQTKRAIKKSNKLAKKTGKMMGKQVAVSAGQYVPKNVGSHEKEFERHKAKLQGYKPVSRRSQEYKKK